MAGKAEIISMVAEGAGITKAVAADAVDSFLNAVSSSLDAGDVVTFRGFGTFKVKEVAARTGRNPQTGEAIKIPAKKKVTFKASK